jgi:hypothetical protein
MDTFVLCPLEESMTQHGACHHGLCQRYMTILVINHGITKSIRILTMVIHPRITLGVDISHDCFRHEVRYSFAMG